MVGEQRRGMLWIAFLSPPLALPEVPLAKCQFKKYDIILCTIYIFNEQNSHSLKWISAIRFEYLI